MVDGYRLKCKIAEGPVVQFQLVAKSQSTTTGWQTGSTGLVNSGTLALHDNDWLAESGPAAEALKQLRTSLKKLHGMC